MSGPDGDKVVTTQAFPTWGSRMNQHSQNVT